MSVTLNEPYLLALLIAFVRVAAWLSIAPPFSNRQMVPAMVRVIIAAGLAILLAPVVLAHGVPTDTAGLAGAIVVSIFIGAALGFVVLVLVSVAGASGALIDQFGGLNPPPALDPLSENQLPILGTFYNQIVILLLFVSNGELLLVKGLATSFEGPRFSINSMPALANAFAGELGTFFAAALEIAAPVLAVLFATQIALAILSKAAPQVNVWFLGFPLQVMLTLVLVTISIKVLPAWSAHLLDRMLHDMNSMIKAGV